MAALFCGKIFLRQLNVVEVKGFVLCYHAPLFPTQGRQVAVHIKGVLFVSVREVFIAGVAGDVVFLTKKRPHATHLQNTLASVHRCNFVLAHQLPATLSSGKFVFIKIESHQNDVTQHDKTTFLLEIIFC